MPERHFLWRDHLVAVDLRPQVLRLGISPAASWLETWQEYGELEVVDAGGGRVTVPAKLYASPVTAPEGEAFVAASVLAHKAKAIDDGVVAALDLLLDEGTATFQGRTGLLLTWREAIRRAWERAPGDVASANAFGLLAAALAIVDGEDGDPASLPTALRLRRSRSLKAFRALPGFDDPPGVYGWSSRLTGLYRQAKGLQQETSHDVADALSRGLDDDLRESYRAHLALAAVTNTFVGPSLIDEPGDVLPAVFPASDSPEGRLLRRLVGRNPVPERFDLVSELIARASSGELDLTPADDSGWYDRAVHALEPLIAPDATPEAVRLRFDDDYRDDLRALFRSLLGLARESHVKQLAAVTAGSGLPPLIVAPKLTFEPTAEHYRRRAESYRFVRERLVELLGESTLASRPRLSPRGSTDRSILDALAEAEQLYRGAWGIVRDEIGMPAAPEPSLPAAKAAARAWAASHRQDPDMADDVRMMVPLFYDLDRHEYHVSAVLGYELRRLRVSFAERPAVAVRDRFARRVEVRPRFETSSFPLLRPVSMTCRTKRPLSRAAFRALCDRERHPAAIRAAVEAEA